VGYREWFLLSIWAVSSVAGLFRCLRNGDYQSFRDVCAVALCSGTLGFAIVALIVGDPRDPNFNPIKFFGIAAIIGLAGKEQTIIISALWRAVVGRFIQLPSSDGDNHENQ